MKPRILQGNSLQETITMGRGQGVPMAGVVLWSFGLVRTLLSICKPFMSYQAKSLDCIALR